MKKITLPEQDYHHLREFVIDWLAENHQLEIGQFDAEFFLDALLKKAAPALYNQGLNDALNVVQNNMLTVEELIDLEKVLPEQVKR